MKNNVYELQFSPRFIDLFHSRMLIGQLSDIDQIISIQTSFHDENGNIILDDFGNPIQYASNRQDLGHVLEIMAAIHQLLYYFSRFLNTLYYHCSVCLSFLPVTIELSTISI